MTDPRTLLLTLRQQLDAMVAQNRAADVDKVGRVMLDALNERAGNYLVAIRADLARPIVPAPFGTLGKWQTHQPAIQSLIRDSEIQRRLGRGRVVHRGIAA